ncbi:hypothetical protein [Pukyongiella litopenaei]|uniref:Uncharacterized protein n=1 Tax=Pukyongiella litopenaei TaxID=2605946 RepID=A0A2S0ML72_9RHOB|nr:hypothetical protein [Pukyongiella litopenaei]AVO36616.2 hypothetical protein C6Y53_02150 [Pukyongiella litopenaei]
MTRTDPDTRSDPTPVSDDLLARLAGGGAHVELADGMPALLPAICAELLQWRQTARSRPSALSLALRSEAIAARLDRARRTIRAPEPVSAHDLAEACETLLRHSPHADERTAAADVLAQMKVAA